MALAGGAAVWSAAGRWADVAAGDRTAFDWGSICSGESR
jgi:hypothetical protein